MEHESDDYINCNRCSCYCHRRIDAWIGGLRNNRTSGDYLNTTLSRSVRILWRILENWGDLLSLKLQWNSVSIGWPIGAMYSGVWNPIKEDLEKWIGRLKAGSADRRLETLATLFATTVALPRVLNMTVPWNINLLKADSRLTVIANQTITFYSKRKPLVFFCTLFF